MDSCSISVDVSGAKDYLKSEGKRNDKDIQSMIHKALGLGEKTIKLNCPVDFGFLKNSVHSEKISEHIGAVYTSVNYAVIRNYVNFKNPHRRFFIEKAEKAINDLIDNYE